MPEDEKPDVNNEEIVDPQGEQEEVVSPAAEPQPGEATPQEEAVEKEPPFNEHPRFKEVIAEKNELKQTVANLQQQIVDIATSQKTPSEQKDAVDELLVDQDDDTKKWVNNFLKPVIQKVVDNAKKEATQPLVEQLQRSNAMVGEVIADRFIEKNPEIVKGSPEMEAVTKEAAELTKYGMPIKQALEKAKRIVMFDKVGKRAVEKVKADTKEKNKEKEKANLEVSTIPSQTLSKEKELSAGDISMEDFEKDVKAGGYVFGQ